MKKFLAFILILTMVLAVSCNQITDSTEDTTKDITKDTTTQDTTTQDTTVQNTSDQIKDSQTNIGILESGCSVAYFFGCVADLETYINTGSLDPADYTVPLEEYNNLDALPSPEAFKARGYVPLSAWFHVDESLYEDIEVAIEWSPDGNLYYNYKFDQVAIGIIPTHANTITEYMVDKNRINSAEMMPSFYTDPNIMNGYVLRESHGLEIAYQIQNGLYIMASFVKNGHTVEIVYISNNDPVTQQQYDSFMGNDAYDCMSALFSDDEQVFTAQIDRILSAANDHVTE